MVEIMQQICKILAFTLNKYEQITKSFVLEHLIKFSLFIEDKKE